jgi:hypothetical protein
MTPVGGWPAASAQIEWAILQALVFGLPAGVGTHRTIGRGGVRIESGLIGAPLPNGEDE